FVKSRSKGGIKFYDVLLGEWGSCQNMIEGKMNFISTPDEDQDDEYLSPAGRKALIDNWFCESPGESVYDHFQGDLWSFMVTSMKLFGVQRVHPLGITSGRHKRPQMMDKGLWRLLQDICVSAQVGKKLTVRDIMKSKFVRWSLPIAPRLFLSPQKRVIVEQGAAKAYRKAWSQLECQHMHE
ncbi:unnamed protein product, partial [Discosporangium mesarthrocarpum]